MATASNPPPAPVQSVNSPSSRHSRMESPARGVASLSDSSSPSSLLGSFDQERFVALTSDLCLYEVIGSPAVTSCFLTEDVADAQPEGSENGGVIKKPVWNKPANGVASEVGVVMGADSWPALSKSARATSKASSTDPLKELSHGSLTLSKGMSVGSSFSQEEVVNTIVSATNLASNHESPRSMEQGDGSLSRSSVTANGSLSQAPNTHSSVVETPPFNPVKSSSSMGESHRDNTHRDVGLRGGSYNGNEHHQSRGPFRRNNNGPQPRGNGSVHHSHGGKRENDRVKQDWSNTHRSFGSRESLATQQRVASRPFIRGPISNPPFISPPPPPPMAMRPYGHPVFYNDMLPHMFYVPGPHPPMVPFAPMFYPMPDPHLPSKIVSQIEYYFSDENLVKDTFLRQKMDCDGWVPISLLATFKKIRELTDSIQLILDALRASNVVEIQGEKVRRKGNWMKWIMPLIMHPTGTSPQPPNNSSQDVLAARINNVVLDEKAAK